MSTPDTLTPATQPSQQPLACSAEAASGRGRAKEAGSLDRAEDRGYLEPADVAERSDRLGEEGVQPADSGYPAYVYQFDYTPVPDPARLGAAHCAELPFLFGTFDAFADSPMLGEPAAAARALARTFPSAVAAFAATGRPDADQWHPYDPADPATVRHFL